MGQTRFTLRKAMLVVTVSGFCFALFGVAVGGMFGTAALIVILHPHSSRWETCELAAILAWLLGVTLEFSGLFVGLGLQLCVATFGFGASVSWLLRLLNKYFAPHSETAWISLCIVPIVMLAAIVLAAIMLAFANPAYFKRI